MKGDSRHGWAGGLCNLRTYFLLLVVLGAFKISNSLSLQRDCKLCVGRTVSYASSLLPTALN